MGKILTIVAAWVAELVGERVAIVLVAVTATVTLVVGFTIAMTNLMLEVVPTLHPLVRTGVSLMPASVGVYWAIIVSSMALRWAFDQNMKLIQMVSGAK